jgi:hypothetical protein
MADYESWWRIDDIIVKDEAAYGKLVKLLKDGLEQNVHDNTWMGGDGRTHHSLCGEGEIEWTEGDENWFHADDFMRRLAPIMADGTMSAYIQIGHEGLRSIDAFAYIAKYGKVNRVKIQDAAEDAAMYITKDKEKDHDN